MDELITATRTLITELWRNIECSELENGPVGDALQAAQDAVDKVSPPVTA